MPAFPLQILDLTRAALSPVRRVIRRFDAALVAAAFCLAAQGALANVTVTAATNGTSISADRAANATSPAWTSLGPITITEGTNRLVASTRVAIGSAVDRVVRDARGGSRSPRRPELWDGRAGERIVDAIVGSSPQDASLVLATTKFPAD